MDSCVNWQHQVFVHVSESGMNSQKQAERVLIIQLVCEIGRAEMKGKGGG